MWEGLVRFVPQWVKSHALLSENCTIEGGLGLPDGAFHAVEKKAIIFYCLL